MILVEYFSGQGRGGKGRGGDLLLFAPLSLFLAYGWRKEKGWGEGDGQVGS